jgi:hypothetical protein
MTVSTRLVLGCIALVALAPAFAQSVYSWKDAKGVTHYSDTPPPKGTETRKVKPQPAPPAPVAPDTAKSPAAPQANASGAAADKVAAAEREKQRAESCKNAQSNLTLLQGSGGVEVDSDGDGKGDQLLDTAQRAKEIENMQAAVQANCS